METADQNRISDNDMAYDSMYDRMEETAGRKNSERSENNYDRMYSLWLIKMLCIMYKE